MEELHQLQESGQKPVILDVRSKAAVEEEPLLIRGAVHMTMEEVERRQDEIPVTGTLCLLFVPQRGEQRAGGAVVAAEGILAGAPCWEESMLGESAITRQHCGECVVNPFVMPKPVIWTVDDDPDRLARGGTGPPAAVWRPLQVISKPIPAIRRLKVSSN